MKRRRRGTKKKNESRGEKKETHHERFDLHGERGGEGGGKNAGGKIASTLATRKKGGEKSAIPAGVASEKKERHTVYCVERGRWWSGERRKKRGDGLHKNTGYEMQNQHTLMRGCVSRTSGWKIDTIGHES